jgi:hypothetical protein
MRKPLAGALLALALTVPAGIVSAAAEEKPCTLAHGLPGTDLIVTGPAKDGEIVRQFACREDAVNFVRNANSTPGFRAVPVSDNGFLYEGYGGWVAHAAPVVTSALNVHISGVA